MILRLATLDENGPLPLGGEGGLQPAFSSAGAGRVRGSARHFHGSEESQYLLFEEKPGFLGPTKSIGPRNDSGKGFSPSVYAPIETWHVGV
jgi:hypothetical protein